MCIAAVVWLAHPLYRLLVLQNRDEYHNRATSAVGWWEDGEILGGRDEEGGGTWMACSRGGRLALLTNVLELHSLPHSPPSRGDLPLRFLRSSKSPKEFGEEVAKEAHKYNGFNLILADICSKSMVYLSNRPEGDPVLVHDVSPGIHVISNAKLNSPWHKAKRLEVNLKEVLERYGESEIPAKELIEKLMRDGVKAKESQLPRICASNWELSLSSIFVEVDTPLGRYGTRSSAVLTVTTDGDVSFYETFLENDTWHEQTVNYNIHNLQSPYVDCS